MKWILALFAVGALMTACNDDDNGNNDNNGGKQPADKTLAAFAKEFPNAQNVKWDKKKGYDVAYFSLPVSRATAGRNSAWYTEGSDKRTYAKIEISLQQLKEEAPNVVAAWEASQYKKDGYTLDDIDKKEYADGNAPTYKLEVELNDMEYELVYKQDGTLISEKLDLDADDEDDEDDPAPLQVFDFIAKNLPEAVVLESETETEDGVTTYEVTITYMREAAEVEVDLIFDAKYAFKAAVEEIEEEDFANPDILPAKVYAKFQELAKGGEMDDVMRCYTSLDNFKAATNALYVMTVEIENEQGEDEEITYVLDAGGNEVKL